MNITVSSLRDRSEINSIENKMKALGLRCNSVTVINDLDSKYAWLNNQKATIENGELKVRVIDAEWGKINAIPATIGTLSTKKCEPKRCEFRLEGSCIDPSLILSCAKINKSLTIKSNRNIQFLMLSQQVKAVINDSDNVIFVASREANCIGKIIKEDIIYKVKDDKKDRALKIIKRLGLIKTFKRNEHNIKNCTSLSVTFSSYKNEWKGIVYDITVSGSGDNCRVTCDAVNINNYDIDLLNELYEIIEISDEYEDEEEE